jgi:hypothetical protein
VSPRHLASLFAVAFLASVAFLLALAFGAAPAFAQPGVHPPQHAVPPAPQVFPSPMPSLPPPVPVAPGERPRHLGPGGGFVIHRAGFRAWVDVDGTIHFGGVFGGHLGVDPVHGARAGYTFDLNVSLLNWLGEDPHLAEKLAVMDATREVRMEMRAERDATIMERALHDLPRYLGAVWAQAEWAASDRRRILFLLWDEAAEDGNEFLRESGDQARAIIEHFIATRLPPGNPEAYTEEELAVFNSGRSSRRRFDPYEASWGEEEAEPSSVVSFASP